jgi:transposase
VALRSVHKARTQAINQLRALIVTAPDTIRTRLEDTTISELVSTAARFRPTPSLDATTSTKHAMRHLARRIEHLDTEITGLKAYRDLLISHAAPTELMNQPGIGPDVAADPLIAYGSYPGRVHTEAAFAALCGVSAIDASSGLQQRHRLNRGGDRHANRALWRIVTTRMATHQPTLDCITRRTSQGKTKREAIRCLKRYVARHIWRSLTTHPPTLDTP